jgi:hypothetical protein
LTVEGVTGPPYPVTADVRTGVAATFALTGAPGAPFLIAVSATGLVQPGSSVTAGGVVDLPAAPPPAIAVGGPWAPLAMDAAGAFTFTVPVPPAGPAPPSIPLGHQEAVQAVVVDPASPAGFRLTAATQVTVVQGPIVVDLALGDDGAVVIDTGPWGFSLPFFGTSYSQVWICVNGFLTFGLPDTDFTPTPAEFNTGYPRLAPFWTDLEQDTGHVVRYTIHPNPPAGQPPFVQADWIGVPDWGGLGFMHTFAAYADSSGFCRISFPVTTAASMFATLCGIGPGWNNNPQAPKDLSALLTAGGAAGAANESFFEWYGLTSMQGWTGSNNPFDLFGSTLNFLPAGAGALPASTLAYALY